MIRINLAPLEETENKLWYMADALVLVAVLLSLMGGSLLYEAYFEDQLAKIHIEIDENENNSRRLEPALKKFKELTVQVNNLRSKIKALEKITVSKIERYKPVILLEHLQTIRPEGVWFKSLTEVSDSTTIKLVGGAFDNLLVAEFMSALDSTRFGEMDPTDMRSQVFFKSIGLQKVSSKDSAPGLSNTPSSQVQVRTSEATANNQVQIQEEFGSLSELNRFPTFELELIYATREEETAILQPSSSKL